MPPPSALSDTTPVISKGEPLWFIAEQFPYQGEWTVEQFFRHFPDRGYEFVDGFVEKLPVPTKPHQRIAGWIYRTLFDFISANDVAGEAFLMGYRVYTVEEKYREPDVLFLFDSRESTDRNAIGFDVGFEIVSGSPADRERDLVVKRAEYAAAGVPEYWVVDPRDRRVLLLTLDGDEYREQIGTEGDSLESAILPGFRVDVSALFAAADPSKTRPGDAS